MRKKQLMPIAVIMMALSAYHCLMAVEIKEHFKLTGESSVIQEPLIKQAADTEKNSDPKGDFQLLSAWLEPSNTIFASNGYILYHLDLHDAKFYDRFLWDYFVPIISPETGLPSGEYDTLFMPWFVHLPPQLTYMPPDSSQSYSGYWQPYWRFWWIDQQTDYFNPDSCWSFGVGFSFYDMNEIYREPGEWKAEANMTMETDSTPSLLCDTTFNVVDDIPPYGSIYYPPDSGCVGNTCTVKVYGGDNALVEKIELYVDDALVNSSNGGAMEYLWTVPEGEDEHILQAKFYDVYNPPWQLGLSAYSEPVRVSRTSIQATQIVAANNVKLYQYQNDTIFQGHFVSLYDLEIDKMIPVGAIINANKYLLFQLDLKLECYNFGQPATWQPVCKYSLDLSEFGLKEVSGEFIGWNGSILINKQIKTISEDQFGEHEISLKLLFEDQNGNEISGVNLPLKSQVFFNREAKWVKDYVYIGTSRFSQALVPNWYYFWKILDCFSLPIQIQSNYAVYAPNALPGEGGFYKPDSAAKNYFVCPNAGYTSTIVNENADAIITPSGIARVDSGMHCFGFVCRHENTHRTLFLQWWGSWSNYKKLGLDTDGTSEDKDRDNDFIPNWVESTYGLDSMKANTFPPTGAYSIYLTNFIDFEYVVYREHIYWFPPLNIWDPIDWASPGKQTLPRY